MRIIRESFQRNLNMPRPKISLIMPVFNREHYLHEAVDSILQQTYPDFEFIIIDDGSQDGSLEIIRSYQDKRIRFLQNSKNLGVAKTLNLGISLAQGPFIARMDSDDISLPTRLEEQIRFMEVNSEIAACGTWVEYFGRQVPFLEKNLLKEPADSESIRCSFLFNCVLKHPSVMIRRSVLEHGAYTYNETLDRAEDYELWVRISKHHFLANLPKVLLRYRLHPHKVSQLYKESNFEQSDRIRENLLKELGLKPSQKELWLHHELSKRFRREFPTDLRESAQAWLEKIFTQNLQNRIYDPEKLKAVLHARWAHIQSVMI